MAHQKYHDCMQVCYACASECEHCASACLGEEDVKAMARCIQLDRDCADLCLLAARMMARGSEFAERICQLCAEICRACGEECARHSHMEHCRRCAEACFRCAEECEKMGRG